VYSIDTITAQHLLFETANAALYRMFIAARFVTSISWSCTWSKTVPPGVHQWSDQTVVSTSSSLYSSAWRKFWTQTLAMFDVCAVAIADTLCFGGHLTILITTNAGVDKIYWNLVFCLQLDCWHIISSKSDTQSYENVYRGYLFPRHRVGMRSKSQGMLRSKQAHNTMFQPPYPRIINWCLAGR